MLGALSTEVETRAQFEEVQEGMRYLCCKDISYYHTRRLAHRARKGSLSGKGMNEKFYSGLGFSLTSCKRCSIRLVVPPGG
jgi:hypothetical protein